MTRLEKLFLEKKGPILNVYCTAGYPQLDSTMEVMTALQQHGADIIELGIPFSDPLADGPVIQQSSALALKNGMTIQLLFDQLKNFRNSIHIPVILMGYLNPVIQYGFEKFCKDASQVGVDGIILPDLPPFEFESEYGSIMKKYGLDFIFLVTPETPAGRVRKLDSLSSGFLYAVSSSSTTGSDKRTVSTDDYLLRLHEMKLSNPILAGFGIKDKQGFDSVCRFTRGAIIGTGYIQALAKGGPVNTATKSFLSDILKP